ncbi:MAG: hypothetical protein PHG60_00420 [Candidatus Dojkabacteria bacterium]|jgi:hypothetical protein|nr:hypothetical protein [Candidatus Dojkabacteria bacterium]
MEFFKKNKKALSIIIAAFIILGTALALYFFVFDGSLDFLKNEQEVTEKEKEANGQIEDQKGVSPMPEYDERSSSEAIDATYASAKVWSDDSVLYNCTGLPSTVEFEDITYEYIGYEDGKYYRWMCTYYSKAKKQTRIFVYLGGEINDSTEPVDIGENGNLVYDSIDYPTDLKNIVDSTVIYSDALGKGLSEKSYINMYLTTVADYGFVWQVEERSKTDKGEYGIGKIINTYLYDIHTGELEKETQEEVY